MVSGWDPPQAEHSLFGATLPSGRSAPAMRRSVRMLLVRATVLTRMLPPCAACANTPDRSELARGGEANLLPYQGLCHRAVPQRTCPAKRNAPAMLQVARNTPGSERTCPPGDCSPLARVARTLQVRSENASRAHCHKRSVLH